MEIKYKQFVVVPKNPKMSTGKIASQVAHATFMALENQRYIVNTQPTKIGRHEYDNIYFWKEEGMCVIVLECPTQQELMGIAKYCQQWRIPHHLYIDEGLTEIPMGTATCFATGVLPQDKHWMFEQLKLYKDDESKGFWCRK